MMVRLSNTRLAKYTTFLLSSSSCFRSAESFNAPLENQSSLTFQSFRRYSSTSAICENDSSSPLPVVKGAVSVTVRFQGAQREEGGYQPYFLLIQRGKEPNKGSWSLPGGSIEFGEPALLAAQRELSEETLWEDTSLFESLRWHSTAVSTSDSIAGGYHYLIAQFYAELSGPSTLPKISPSDDAQGAGWFTIDEICEKEQKDEVTKGVTLVIQRMEDLVASNLMPLVPFTNDGEDSL